MSIRNPLPSGRGGCQSPVSWLWDDEPLAERIAEVAVGSYQEKAPPSIRGTGYVVQALEAALWAFHHSESFEEGALLAVNLGDDADTTGAIYGQLAGAYYGLEAIPSPWRDTLSHYTLLSDYATGLYALALEGRAEALMSAVRER
ncbi:MAG: hypothetical protein C0631_06890 [Sedimenticola sp.]|nr:MAG: hypothetical protein C0631_06890 [Sedimenticola sp.]